MGIPVADRDGGSSAPVTPPPPPTPVNLQQATGYDAGRSIDAMTPQQRTQLTQDVAAMGTADRANLINDLAAKLLPSQLHELEAVFTAPVVLEAVQTRSPAWVRESYQTLIGGAGDATPGASSGLSASEQVTLAQSDYAGNVERQGIMAQHALCDLMTTHSGDPAYLAELVRIAREDGTLDSVVSPMTGALYSKDGGQYVVTNDNASFDADARRNAFAIAIQAAVDGGVMSESELRELAGGNPAWTDVATRIGIGQVGTNPATQAAASDLYGLLDTQTDAQEDVDRLDQDLGSMLAQAGPMTPEQQAAFIEAYRNDPQHKPTYDTLIESSQAVSAYVAANRDAVLDASVRDPAVAQQVHDAIVTLARGGHGVQAMELLGEIQRAPDSALGQAFAGFTDLSGDVLTDAASSAMSELLASNDGSVTAAQAQFTTLMKAFGQGAPAWGGYKDFTGGQKLLDAFASGDYRAINQYANLYGDSKPIFRAFAAAGVVAGAVSAANAGRSEDYINAIGGFAQSGESAARLVSGAMTSLGEVGRLAQYSERFAGAAGFAARLAPALGLIASAASFANSIDQAADGNVGYAIAAFGDVLGVLGSAMEFTPVAPAGFILSGIGAIISGIGSFVGELINGGERRDQVEGYLRQAGVDPAIVDEMVSSGKQLFEMAEALDLEPAQVQALLQQHPDIGGAPGLAGTFMRVAQACGVSGDEVAGFADALAQDDPNFAWELMGIATSVPSNPDEAAAFYRHYVEGRFPGATEFAQASSPELFGDAAQDREVAVSDYNRDGYSSTWEMSLANDLKNSDSAAYRAEMMGRIASDGRLEMWAQMIGGYGDNWEGAARQSVGDALAAGTISQDDADLVLAYFA